MPDLSDAYHAKRQLDGKKAEEEYTEHEKKIRLQKKTREIKWLVQCYTGA